MLTAAARRSAPDPAAYGSDVVSTMAALRRAGWSPAAIAAQLAARRWQRVGRAVVRHNAALSTSEQRAVALVNAGPRALLTSFTALGCAGLSGWGREPVDVLVPRGARVRRPPGVPVRFAYTDAWAIRARRAVGDRDWVPFAAVVAAATFASPRPACGLLAAVVQQRLARAADLEVALRAASRTRHRAALLAAVHDIGQGAQALSEIDLGRLCRRVGLPAPARQQVRRLPGGRRRYVDAEWTRADGRRLVVEVDGALHLAVRRWWDDQVRQNELAIADDLVLRFPSVVVRHEPALVVDQIRRALVRAR